MTRILIIDSDPDISKFLDQFIKDKGYETIFFANGKKAIEFLKENNSEIIFCDSILPDMAGKDFLLHIKDINPDAKVIIITGCLDVKTAVDVVKSGAFDYVTKPILPDEIRNLVDKVLEQHTRDKSFQNGIIHQDKPIAVPNKRLAANIKDHITGKSKESEKLNTQIKLVAPTNYTVIIYGDSGVGKESVAYKVHSHSHRKDKSFIAVDCSSLTKEHAFSELFGHEKDSFSGATQTKIGQFELAHGGTLFLDEIGNLHHDVQLSLLRVVQEKRIRRVGSHKETQIDVRIIIASHKKLSHIASEGKLREDLYHHFNEFFIDIPPLYKRNEDVMLFAKFFLKDLNSELNKNIKSFAPEVERAFLSYRWPGNLREMKNVIKQAVLLSGKNEVITFESLPHEIAYPPKYNLKEDSNEIITGSKKLPDLKSAALQAEYEKIMETLRTVNFNKSKAAALLNIDRKTLYNKMKTFNLLSDS